MNRLFNTLFVMAFAAAMTITSAVAQQDKDTNGTAMSAKHSAGTTVADKTFVKKAAAGGLAEVELGQLATQKASSEDVKKFGQRMVDDHSKANDQLKQVAGGRPIIVDGFSLGTVPALAVAAQRPVSGVIIQNPPPLRELIIGGHGWWNLWLLAGPVAAQIPHELDSVNNAKMVHAPAIFLLAEEDEIVASRFQQLVVNAYAGEKRIIHFRGAHHNDPIEGTALTELYGGLDWLLPREKQH